MQAALVQVARKRPDPDTPLIHTEFNLTAVGTLLVGGELIVMGWALKEATNLNPANIDLYDSTAAQGVPTFPVTLLKNESSRETWAPRGVWMQEGLYLNVTTGQVSGSIFWLPTAR